MTAEHFAQHQLLASFVAFLVIWFLSNGTTKAAKLAEKDACEPGTKTIAIVVDYIFIMLWLISLVLVICCIFYTLWLWGTT